MPVSPHRLPDLSAEQVAWDAGFKSVCGVDEAGRGPLAGPVVAAAVILDPALLPTGLRDSKTLNERALQDRYALVLERAVAVAVASCSADTIDRVNIRAASLLAMRRAIEMLVPSADHALIDGNAFPDGLPCAATTLVRGDARSLSIAAASIVAKVSRDRMMRHADTCWPEYGLGKNKGYPTAAHRAALGEHGPCPLHRRTFAPVAVLI